MCLASCAVVGFYPHAVSTRAMFLDKPVSVSSVCVICVCFYMCSTDKISWAVSVKGSTHSLRSYIEIRLAACPSPQKPRAGAGWVSYQSPAALQRGLWQDGWGRAAVNWLWHPTTNYLTAISWLVLEVKKKNENRKDIKRKVCCDL